METLQRLTDKTPEFPQIILIFKNRDWLLTVSDFLMGKGVASVEIQEDFPVLRVILTHGKTEEPVIQSLKRFCEAVGAPFPEIRVEKLVNRDWMAVFREHFTPFAMTRNVFIVPSWLKDEYGETKEGKQVIIVEPGQAFGTGLHATTALATDMVLDYARSYPGFSMIDAGTGSGILSVIAEKNGARNIIAFDIDPLCSGALRTHLALNCSNREKFQLFVGTEAAIRNTVRADLVVINIIETIIRKILPALAPMVTDRLILSGILEQDSDAFISFVQGLGFTVLETQARDEWVAFNCVKN
ncbi:MAG: hypothetical protein DRJ08_04180 [Acidobacteria bacterium]|nr:MAG: hypothetical protein DRJ08_04180 [Acidobacteriota bacterium]